MAVTLEKVVTVTYNIQVEGSHKVELPHSLVKEFDDDPDQQWLQIKATNYKIVKLVSYDLEIPKNPSLADSPGLKNLSQLRNQASGFGEVELNTNLFAEVLSGCPEEAQEEEEDSCNL